MSRNFSLHFDVDSLIRRRALNALAGEWVKRASNAIINDDPCLTLHDSFVFRFAMLLKNSFATLRLHRVSDIQSSLLLQTIMHKKLRPLQLSRSYHVAYSIANLTPECWQQ